MKQQYNENILIIQLVKVRQVNTKWNNYKLNYKILENFLTCEMLYSKLLGKF